MNWILTENERGLECAIVKMALATQECELSSDDLATMRRLTKTLQRYLRVTEIALSKKKAYHKSKLLLTERPRLPEKQRPEIAI